MIFTFLMAAFFTVVYLLMIASTAWQDVLTGALFTTVLMWIFRSVILPGGLPPNRVTMRLLLVAPRYLWMVIRDVFVGTWVVTQCVVGLRPIEHPGIIRIALGESTPAAVGVASLSITFSPGSFLVDVDWEERVMLIHVIDAANWEQIHDDMQEYLTLLEAAMRPANVPPTSGRSRTGGED